MSERIPKQHTHTEVISRPEAWRLAEAAQLVGGVSVRALQNEGETYSNGRGKESVVPEGNIRIRVTGSAEKVGRAHINERSIPLREAA